MKVVSTFNGMGCIWIALDRLKIKVTKRYSSEIDKYANIVNDHNYPDTIQLGDISKIDSSELEDIDLLVGGSPCQGFSFAGKQLNFEDPRSKLFFEFVRLLKEIKPKYFLLENVKMKQEYQNIISKYLGCEPIAINSSVFSCQSRERLYWTNIPNIKEPINNNKTIKSELGYNTVIDAIYNHRPKRIYHEKAPTIRAGRQGQTNENGDKLTPNDYEILQTVPINYTNQVSNSQRYKMLGNGWTVDVIVHLLKPLS